MPKEYFSLAKACSLSEFSKTAKVHFLGVSGVAMAQLAVELSNRGYLVSGSDKEFYDPMGSLLRSSKVKLYTGYHHQNLDPDLDLVVIGNAVSYENEEVLDIEQRKVSYSLFPKLLYETVICGKHSIVVAGTHGKSTTSALGAVMLSKAGYDPSYFVGGIIPEVGKSLNVGEGNFSIVEGDEYDSAFFAKVPKFKFYKPNTLIITSLEFDHADIYNSIDDILAQFYDLASQMSSQDRIIICVDSDKTLDLAKKWQKELSAEIITYGTCSEAKIRLTKRKVQNTGQTFEIQGLTEEAITVNLKISGEYNALNSIAVISAAFFQGCELNKLVSAVSEFSGLKRRQEVRFVSDKYTLIEDFAHHPTAVRKTLAGIRELYPDSNLRVAFEPRSASSMRDVFQTDYESAFVSANEVCVCEVQNKKVDAQFNYLDVDRLAKNIQNANGIAFKNSVDISSHLISTLNPGDVIVVMSNGSFGGLIEKVLHELCSA
ncbi:MAG: hypothetical protein KDD56_07075 [Bdellovibrionales bacterium]|nr:hypothetical protein [Bdellovibrionales bacterium]